MSKPSEALATDKLGFLDLARTLVAVDSFDSRWVDSVLRRKVPELVDDFSLLNPQVLLVISCAKCKVTEGINARVNYGAEFKTA